MREIPVERMVKCPWKLAWAFEEECFECNDYVRYKQGIIYCKFILSTKRREESE